METFSTLLTLCEGIPLTKANDSRALKFSLICASTNGWANNGDAGDLRCHHAHYDITVMLRSVFLQQYWCLLTADGSSPESALHNLNFKPTKTQLVEDICYSEAGGQHLLSSNHSPHCILPFPDVLGLLIGWGEVSIFSAINGQLCGRKIKDVFLPLFGVNTTTCLWTVVNISMT